MLGHRSRYDIVAAMAITFFSCSLTSFEASAEDAWLITNEQGDRCLDAELTTGDPLPNGTKVQLWECWGGQNQSWTRSALDQFRNAQGGRCLDAELTTSGPLPNGTKVQLWDCWNGFNQGWRLKPAPPVHCDPAIHTIGLINERYWPNAHGLGCPVTQEYPDGNGRYQEFEHGAMVWSPNIGPRAVLVAYAQDGTVYFNWGPTDPYNYDKWIVRYDRNGINIGQDDVCEPPSCLSHLTMGYWSRNLGPGRYRLVVEGCDEGSTGDNTCRQGWSQSVELTVP